MKKLILIALVAIAFASCGKDEVSKGQLDPSATARLYQSKSASKVKSMISTDVIVHLSALEIAKKVTTLRYTYNGVEYTRGFSALQRDTISGTPCLKMWGEDIISAQGTYQPEFVESVNCILEVTTNFDKPTQHTDTVAYFKNSTLKNASLKIKTALAIGNYTECYSQFDTAFTYIPITGKEYRDLKLANQQ